MDEFTIKSITKEAVQFAKNEKIREMILYILDREGRKLEHISGLPASKGFWPWSSQKNAEDTRLYQRQYPLAGTGVLLVQEQGYGALGVFARHGADILFRSLDKNKISIFRMGPWLWSLRVEYDGRRFREARPDFNHFEQAFMPVNGFETEQQYRETMGMFASYKDSFPNG